MAKATKKPKKQTGNDNTAERVRRRAYDLFERRGGQHGNDMEDWLQAEQEILRETESGE